VTGSSATRKLGRITTEESAWARQDPVARIRPDPERRTTTPMDFDSGGSECEGVRDRSAKAAIGGSSGANLRVDVPDGTDPFHMRLA
jgi:hypothetical protein